MSRRALNFDSVLTELKTKSPGDQSVLNVLIKIEVGAIEAAGINMTKIRQFLQYIPNSGYHFGFVQTNTLYYIMSNVTFGTSMSKVDGVNGLLREFKKLSERANTNSPQCEFLCNSAVIHTMEQTVQKIEELKSSFSKNPFLQYTVSGDHGRSRKDVRDTGAAFMLNTVLTEIQNIGTITRALVNCRAIAELLDEVYKTALEWFNNTLQFTAFQTRDDGDLDLILKMFYFYKYHKVPNQELLKLFTRHVEDRSTNISSLLVQTFDENQQIGSEYVRDISYAIASQKLNAGDPSKMVFPVLRTDMSILKSMCAENLFFHPGLIYHILNMSNIRAADSVASMELLSDVCVTASVHLFQQEGTGPPATLQTLTNKVRDLASLGLNEHTAKMYVQMIQMRSAFPDASNAGSERIHCELINLIIMICYNAYIFFMCLSRYSPTFLFHNRKKLLLDQQKSALIGTQGELNDIWQNILLNTNKLFKVWFTEDEFNVQTKQLNHNERLYLYRDIVNKWGEMLFTFNPSKGTAEHPQLTNAPDITAKYVVDSCKAVEHDEQRSYETLVPISTNPAFAESFVSIVMIPRFVDVLDMSYSRFRAHGHVKLLQLIYACQLLLPNQLRLYQSLVSLYNLIQLMSRVDTAVSQNVYALIQDAITALEGLCSTSVTTTMTLMIEIMIYSLVHKMRTTIDPTIRSIESNKKYMLSYMTHMRQCYILSFSDAHFKPNDCSVTIRHDNKDISVLPMKQFVQTCRALVVKNSMYEEKIESLKGMIERLRYRTESVVHETKSIKDYLTTHPSGREFNKFINKITKTIKSLEQTLVNDISTCKRSTGLVILSMNRIVATVEALDTEKLERQGESTCISEALGLIRSSGSFTKPPKGDSPPSHQDVRDTVSEIFETKRATNIQTPTALYMSAITDVVIEKFTYPNVLDTTLHLLGNEDDIRDWYVASKEQTYVDITQPFIRANDTVADLASSMQT